MGSRSSSRENETFPTTFIFDVFLSAKVVTNKADCLCGEERREVCDVSSDHGGMDYIWNGNVTKVNQYPWMVRLDGVYLCGGSLIASKYVLTAAHCVTSEDDPQRKVPMVKVYLGDHDKTISEQTCLKQKTFKVRKEKIIVHENYIYIKNRIGKQVGISRMENDIALLELDEEVDLRHYTPVCLPRKDDADQVGRALALGWGGDGTAQGTNAKLNSVEVRDLRTLLNWNIIPNGQFVGNGIKENNKGACQGDSGGPLTYQVEGRHVLIGATSFGPGCGQSITSYSAFTRVSFYTDWIYKHMESPKFCSKATNHNLNRTEGAGVLVN